MNDLKKKIFVTGASGGIGSAICNRFFKNNFTLVLTSSSEEKKNILKKKYGNDHYYYKTNLSNSNELQETMKEISNSHKDISIIVNNAGITEDNLIFRMKYEQWTKVIQTNLDSNYLIIKSLLPNMISRRYGKIIGISSVVGITGNPGQSNYVASKSGMIGLYKSIALEVAKRNITVNCIAPGFIATKMTENILEANKDNLLKMIPMGKAGDADDVANLVCFLASDFSNYITGQTIHINGGMLMS